MSKNKFEILTLNSSNITDFSRARNELLKKAKSKWVLFLDSDERFSEELRREIDSEIVKNINNGYYIYRENYFLGRNIGKDKILRLAKVGTGKWERKVHEVWTVKGSIDTLKNTITHKTAKSLMEYIEKINKYSILHAEANKLEGKRSSVLKIIFYPKLKFVESLIMGRGVVFSILQSFHSFLAWSNLWLSQRK